MINLWKKISPEFKLGFCVVAFVMAASYFIGHVDWTFWRWVMNTAIISVIYFILNMISQINNTGKIGG